VDPDPGSALEIMDPDSGYFFEIYKTNSESKKILFFVFSIVKIWVLRIEILLCIFLLRYFAPRVQVAKILQICIIKPENLIG